MKELGILIPGDRSVQFSGVYVYQGTVEFFLIFSKKFVFFWDGPRYNINF